MIPKKALVTLAIGEMANTGQLTLPPLLAYGKRHGYDVFYEAPEMFREFAERDPYNYRYLFLSFLLRHKYDLVVWVDADVLVVNPDEDIADDLHSSADLGYVEVHTKWLNTVRAPNDGVLIARNSDVLDRIMEINEDSKDLKYIKAIRAQAGLWHLAGIDFDSIALSGYPSYVPGRPVPWVLQSMRYEWNYMPADTRGEPDPVRFIHFSDRNEQRRLSNIRRAKEKYQIV